ncbi:hypothetical protein [Chitinophaga silvisoli]|uniref:ABC transporter permease n=1 Tax=Chitinophaga silvisoli TaxID=2291814 RepID=A0A3E1NZN2_9BACT|nr:hypothetical protein [Chitinophaga silvisoli]RFM33407.1 hypothetical protein DXN04_20510 [Chitinophaga silvisoli]
MIINSIKVAWRNLSYNRLFSALNIFGLAMGLTIAILLSLYIIQERSFDAIPNQDRTFRYLAHVSFDGTKSTWSGVPNQVGPTVQEHIPEVELSARTVLNDFGENANFGIGETTVTFIAIICGLILAMPLFNSLSGKTLMYELLSLRY